MTNCRFSIILSEKLANFCVISREIDKITAIGMNGISQIRTEVKRDSVKCELSEWQFSYFFMILSEKLANFCVISRQITNMTRLESKRDFTI